MSGIFLVVILICIIPVIVAFPMSRVSPLSRVGPLPFSECCIICVHVHSWWLPILGVSICAPPKRLVALGAIDLTLATLLDVGVLLSSGGLMVLPRITVDGGRSISGATLGCGGLSVD